MNKRSLCFFNLQMNELKTKEWNFHKKLILLTLHELWLNSLQLMLPICYLYSLESTNFSWFKKCYWEEFHMKNSIDRHKGRLQSPLGSVLAVICIKNKARFLWARSCSSVKWSIAHSFLTQQHSHLVFACLSPKFAPLFLASRRH